MAAQLETLQASLGAQTSTVIRQHSSLEEARSQALDSEERMRMTVRGRMRMTVRGRDMEAFVLKYGSGASSWRIVVNFFS